MFFPILAVACVALINSPREFNLQATLPGTLSGQVVDPATMFKSPFNVIEPTRIALTPVLDGKIQEDEWDPLATLADESKTYLQWEPGKLHVAAVVPNGHDLLISLDLDSNGWLIGQDNIEVRISARGNVTTVQARKLDCSQADGPNWVSLPGFEASTRAVVATDGVHTTYEVTIGDTGTGLLPDTDDDKLGVRIDDPVSSDAAYPPYLPRTTTPITLSYVRTAGLPAGLSFAPEGEARSYVAGERARVRLTFKGTNALGVQQIVIRTIGLGKDDTNYLAAPFPNFDNRGRTFIDFDTGIRETASLGFRILRASVTGKDGLTGIIDTSYRFSPPLDFAIVRQEIQSANVDRSIRFGFYLRSNSGKPMRSTVSVSVPEPIKVLNGTSREFEISSARGRARQNLDLFVPANYSGTIPIRFTCMIGSRAIDQTGFVTIGK